MRTTPIGSLDATVVGLGCNNFGRRVDADGAREVVDAALDAGIRFFDTADAYGEGASEELLGRALGSRRGEVVIATKFGMEMGAPERSGASPRWIREAVQGSLQRLGTDHIDLYQVHRPDPGVPIAETLGALDELVREGLVREIGNSNFDGSQIDEAERVAGDRGTARFVTAQNHWSLLTPAPEEDVLPACRRHGLRMLPYFPLESGLLTGKYTRGEQPPEDTRLGSVPQERAERFLNDENFDTAERLERFAAEQGRSLLELAFSWLASQDECASVIAGATSPDQVRANAAAAGWKLSVDEMDEVARITGRR